MSELKSCRMRIESPIGDLFLVSNGLALTDILFSPFDEEEFGQPDEILQKTRVQLEEYFEGRRWEFDLPVTFIGTHFGNRVCMAMIGIPYGETISYGELARWVGRPGAARAVGQAVGRNRIPIISPCHRVVGADGSLTGFGGGLHVKRFLLALESRFR